MPPGLPHQPLAMRLWLFRRSGRGSGADLAGSSSGRSMSIGSLEHLMRNRFRMFLRHTWLVTILGTIVLGGLVWAAFYYSTKNTEMRIATGPNGTKIVQVLASILAKSHDRLQLQVVTTDSANASAQALSNGSADLAIVPTTVGKSPNWPVVAILRQNVIALIGAGTRRDFGRSRCCRTGACQEGRNSQGDQDRQAGKNGEGEEDRQDRQGQGYAPDDDFLAGV